MSRPHPIPVSELRHLSAAMEYVASNGVSGNCFQRSAALALDLKGAEVVFGTLRPASAQELAENPAQSSVPFVHAWVEWRGWLYAPTTVERTNMMLVAWPPQEYYELNQARDIRRLPHDEFQRIARRFKLSAAYKHLSKRAGNGAVTDAMLTAAGVRYRLTENLAVLPLED